MKNKILLVHFPMGPTYKSRVLQNIKTVESYKYFDVLILTEDVEYFKEIVDKENIIIKHMDDLRKDYPWSIEMEPVPPIIESDVEYVKYIQENDFTFSTLFERFAWSSELMGDYDGYIFANCDISPKMDDDGYQVLENYFCNNDFTGLLQFGINVEELQDKIISIPGAGNYDAIHHGFLKDFAEKINNKLNITDKEIKEDAFFSQDGNLRTFKFPDKETRNKFFNFVNDFVHEIFTDDEYFVLRRHTMWRLHSEYILSIAFNLFGAKVYPSTVGTGVSSSYFSIGAYPEDRFWNWYMELPNQMVIYPTTLGKEHFIQINYEALKTYYLNRGQVFPYVKQDINI